MSLVSGLDLEGSRTVAMSTPVRLSVPLTDAPRQPAFGVFGLGWRTSELKIPEEIPDDDHELVIERLCASMWPRRPGRCVCV